MRGAFISTLAGLFRRCQGKAAPPREAKSAADSRGAQKRTVAERLTRLRHLARTGDPKRNIRRSGPR